jgi:cytochrome c oxidase assembly factor CtaG
MMMAAWGLLDSRDLKSLNATRTLLVCIANVIAVLTFILVCTVVMLIAAAADGYGGAPIGRRASSKVIRAGTLFLTGCITLAFFVHTYAR